MVDPRRILYCVKKDPNLFVDLLILIYIYIYMCVFVCVCVCVYLCMCILIDTITWHMQDVIQGQFYADFIRFELRVFLLLDQILHRGYGALSPLIFTNIWRDISWNQLFPKSVGVKVLQWEMHIDLSRL